MELEKFKSNIIPMRQNLFAFAMKMLQNKDDAEDVVQESLLRLWNIRQQLDDVSNTSAFAMQITKNICIDKLRTSKQVSEIDEFDLGSNEETPYSQAEIKDMVEFVKTIIEKLPELQKIIIKMRDIDGYEIEKIAEITGTNTSAVRMNLSRARKTVKKRLMKIARL
ncbi:MAG: sigma-70 family RNA polymerase sigma factor [Prevotellaceae bacterium]|jgi:RNA polymerase sigma-70 factor (ECF subfamily)|nr:sigma-70 family RNA polymerase sigma factor [Prevotellaceae bacterium]